MKENTSEILFSDDEPQWFITLAQQMRGPMKASEVYSHVQKNELTLMDYIWKQGFTDWKKISECAEFQVILPQKPQMDPTQFIQAIPQVKKAQARTQPPSMTMVEHDSREWFLHYQQTQYGPFSLEEVQRLISVGQIQKNTHAWKEGMTEWKQLQALNEFKSMKTSTAPPLPVSEKNTPKENRGTPRVPLMARFLLTDENTVISGMCRDVSLGGMQVLTSRIPGGPGTRIKINVSPDASAKLQDAFAAEGVIVRILEDQRGFSFRFTKIQEDAKKTIENYTKNE